MVGGERDWAAQVAATAQRYRVMREQVDRISVTETSRDGAVRVTVSSTGTLTDLVLPDRGRNPTDLAGEVMDTLRRAQARIPDLIRQAAIDTGGGDDPHTHLVVESARARFPEQQQDSPPWTSGPPRTPPPLRPKQETEDDWYDQPAVFDVGVER
jgi:DNA-binding protein YbaB